MKVIFRRIADYIRECDKLLYILCFVTTIYGSIAVLSATYFVTGRSLKQFIMQIVAMALGTVAVIIISNFDYKNFARLWPVIYLVGFSLVILTFFKATRREIPTTRHGSCCRARFRSSRQSF